MRHADTIIAIIGTITAIMGIKFAHDIREMNRRFYKINLKNMELDPNLLDEADEEENL